MILIDADSLVYSCGFACQSNSSSIVAEDSEGNLREDITSNLTEWKSANKGWKVISRDVTIDAQPEQYAIHSMRLALSAIIAKCDNVRHEMFISGSTNFRDKIATIQPYKGNRDKLHKPVHYEALRAYLKSEGAHLVEGIEADDEVSIYSHELLRAKKEFIVASIDKDLNQIPGRHYNPQQDKFYDVTKRQAHDWFVRQILTGDATDNVAGCWRVGPAAAEKLLNSISPSKTGWWGRIVEAYADSQSKAGCPYKDYTAEEAALENARLVFMLHNRKQATNYWSPK